MTNPVAAPAGTDPATGQPAAPAPTPVPVPAAPAAPVTGQPAPAPTADDLAKLRADLETANGKTAEWRDFARKHEARAKELADQQAEQQRVMTLLAQQAGVDISASPDPAKLAEQVATQQAAARTAQTQLAVYLAAQAAGANGAALTDSMSFMNKAQELDPSSATYAADMQALAAAHVAANPTAAVGTQPAAGQPAAPAGTTPQAPTAQAVAPVGVPAASGPATAMAPPAGDGQWTMADVNAATPEALTKALQEGKLKSLGFGASRGARHGR